MAENAVPIAESQTPPAFDPGCVASLEESVLPDAAAVPRLLLYAHSQRLRRLLPSTGHVLRVLPFFVGRVLTECEPRPPITIDFTIRDEPPYRLAGVHFSVTRENEALIVRDFGTEHGTEVNGRLLGGDPFRCETAPLHKGDNFVAAGGARSPYVFRLRLE